jgi:hypothetical protein
MFPAGPLAQLLMAAHDCTEASDAAVASQFLVALGNAIGSNAYTYVGETRHGVNENLLVVGPTATGRKGDGKNIAFAVLREADPEWAKLIASGLSSGEGLIHAVRDEVHGTSKKGEDVITDPGVADKRLCVVESEFSSPLKMFRRDGNVLSDVMRNAWDSYRVLRTLTKIAPTYATDPHISIIGHATPEDLRAHLADLDVMNGTGNRFLIVAVDRVRVLPSPPRIPERVRRQLVEEIRRVLDRARDAGHVPRTARARELWNGIYPELTTAVPGLVGALLARSAAHVTRLSLLFALLGRAREVDVQHLKSALAWWDYVVQSAGIIFAGRTGNRVADRLRAELLPGQRITLASLRKDLFANHVEAGELRDGIELSRRLGDIDYALDSSTGGRPALVVTRLPVAVAEQNEAAAGA